MLMEELAKKLADRDYMEAELLERTGAGGKAERIEGKKLGELFSEVAPKNYKVHKWGPLSRSRMSDNTYWWFCDKHAEEFRK